VKVTSPMNSTVTDGHLCIKGRFGFEFTNAPRDAGATPVGNPPKLQRPAIPTTRPETRPADLT
jgi:hypothetical protein